MSSAAEYDLHALLSHEGVPGHHLQLSVRIQYLLQ